MLNSYLHSQVLSHDTRISVDKKGRKRTEKRLLIQINGKHEEWLSEIEIRHSPQQDLSFDYAQILDMEGNVLRKVRKRDLTTRSLRTEQAFYMDDLVTEVDLYWHQYPYQIEYAYTIEEEEFIFLSWWSPVFHPAIPTEQASLQIDIPADYAVNISEQGKMTKEKSEIEGRIIYNWQASSEKMEEAELFSPPVHEYLPQVSVVPEHFKYGVEGNSNSWKSLGKWFDLLNEGTAVLPLNDTWTLKKMVAEAVDKKDTIRKLYHYLQDNTRYINVAIDVGGLKSYPATYVLKNQYGDCKALTTYMKAMLHSVGIDSYYTVINGGSNEERVIRDFPSQQFNHVILAVPLEKDTLWLENTSNSVPFGYLGTFTQDRYGMAVAGSSSKLVKTPGLLASDVLVEREHQFSSNGNTWSSKSTLKLRSRRFEAFRHYYKNQDQEQLEQLITESVGLKGFEVESWQVRDFHRDSSFVEILAQGPVENPVRAIAQWQVITPLQISIPEFEQPADRNLEVRINFPISNSDRSIFRFEDLETSQVEIPEDILIKGEYGRYATRFRREGNSIFAEEEFTLAAQDIPVAKYPEFYAFIQSIQAYKKKSAILIK